jgi:hypothetical protein
MPETPKSQLWEIAALCFSALSNRESQVFDQCRGASPCDVPVVHGTGLHTGELD